MKKKVYRKIVAAALTAAMVLSMAGCGDKNDTQGSSSAGNEPGSSQTGTNESAGSDDSQGGEDGGTHEFS